VVASACHSYTWAQNNQTYTQSGNYHDTLVNHLNCDSIITLNLTIHTNTTATQNYLECDSFTWINGITYTSSVDTVTYIIPNATGCDSIITLDLTILNLHFTQQPTNAQANTGTNAVFQAAGSPVGANHRWQTYQGGSWHFLMDTGQYTGSLTNSLTVSNITVQNHQQQYRCVLYLGACSDTSDVAQIVVPDIGIGETPASAQFTLFPNPVKDEFTLAVEHAMMGSPYSLTDQSGRVVLSGIADADRISVHVGHLPVGIYLFSFDGMPASTVRVVKQ
jgi:hypothetical protein